MSNLKNNRKRKLFIIAFSVFIALTIIVGACGIYLGDYYKADRDAIYAFSPMISVSFEKTESGNIVFKPDNATKGFIFYPGGKVAYDSYQPLMAACAEQGILCVLVEMPFNLAVFDINAADGIQQQYPQIEDWYIGGHSLGGSMAASYLEKNAENYEGLILLGSYSTADLSETHLDVLSVYGSEDKVMNREKYEENKVNLPDDFTEVIIDGGCHAGFGMYGAQDGDGIPAISNEEQIYITVEHIIRMMK